MNSCKMLWIVSLVLLGCDLGSSEDHPKPQDSVAQDDHSALPEVLEMRDQKDMATGETAADVNNTPDLSNLVPNKECWPCASDSECESPLMCNKRDGYCAPPCLTDHDCPRNSACELVGSAQQGLCVSGTVSCCFGTECEDAGCPPERPFFQYGTCVECFDKDHCSPGLICWIGHCQTSQYCDEKHPFVLHGVCVECVVDEQCPSPGLPRCVEGYCRSPDFDPDGPWDSCAYCVDPYPACVEINGLWSCVQCDDNSDCFPNGVCDLSLYACEAPNPCGPEGCPHGSENCSADEDCVSSKGLQLTCDIASLRCYDAMGGTCDGVESFCAGGLACMGIADVVGPDHVPSWLDPHRWHMRVPRRSEGPQSSAPMP